MKYGISRAWSILESYAVSFLTNFFLYGFIFLVVAVLYWIGLVKTMLLPFVIILIIVECYITANECSLQFIGEPLGIFNPETTSLVSLLYLNQFYNYKDLSRKPPTSYQRTV
jgi:hypothetical protein